VTVANSAEMVELLQTQSLIIDYVEAWQGSNVGLSKARVKDKARNFVSTDDAQYISALEQAYKSGGGL